MINTNSDILAKVKDRLNIVSPITVAMQSTSMLTKAQGHSLNNIKFTIFEQVKENCDINRKERYFKAEIKVEFSLIADKYD